MSPARAAALRPGRRAAAPLVAAALLAAPHAASGQEQAPLLPLLSFDLSQRLELGSGPPFVTALDFGFLDETRSQSLSLAGSVVLRLGDDEDDGDDGDDVALDGPVLSFGYERRSADASLSLTGTVRREDLSARRGLGSLVDEDGGIDLPDDFEDLDDDGTRRELSFDAVLSLGEGSRVGTILSFGATDLSYEDATDPDLDDSQSLRVGAALRLSLGAGREARVGLRYAFIDEEGDRDQTVGLDLGATAERPRGALSAALSFDRTDDGLRAALSVGRTLAFPTGALSGSLGLARSEDGDLLPTVSLSLRRDGPRDALALSLDRSLRAGSDNDEEVVTTFAASLGRELSPRMSLSLDVLLAATDDSGAGGDDGSARELDAGATVSYALSPDWRLQAGLRLFLRDEDGERERDETVFVGLSRRFAWTF